MTEEELLHTLALIRVPGLGLRGAQKLLQAFGSAVDVFRRREELSRLANGGTKLAESLSCPEAFDRARREMEFIHKNHIESFGPNDPDYPSRLRECPDAPLLLFYRGSTPLNRLHVISMVGTRHITNYGRDLCATFLRELKQLCPDVLVVSGLAYGVDVCTHRAALDEGLDTIGVLAHGLDRIYPPANRQTAVQMTAHGGLLTEFMSETNPDRQNFVMRNRIVAGMSDATLIVESAAKGGALITAEMANSYHRDCFAFPGRCNDPWSEGCNALIRDNRAALILSADDFVKAMRWDTSPKTSQPIQRLLFPDLSPEEQAIVDILRQSPDGMPLNDLALAAQTPVNKLSALLFEMELKGVVHPLPGSRYKLI